VPVQNDEHERKAEGVANTKFIVDVPAYYGTEDQEFGEPTQHVVVSSDNGVRIQLGGEGCPERDEFPPELVVERRPNGWCLFIISEGGGDASGFVFMLDDGRCFAVPEWYGPGSMNLVPLEDEQRVSEIQRLVAAAPDTVNAKVETDGWRL